MNSTYLYTLAIFAAVFALGLYFAHRAGREKQAKT